MATVRPFGALRPLPELAARICELPYDVMSAEEAREIARDNPLSFLHVSKAEIDLDPALDSYEPAVYRQARQNFRDLMRQGVLRLDEGEQFYLYRQVMGAHSQIGLVAVVSVAEYRSGIIRKHELTRVDKEDDRVRHMEALGSQTGPVFLTYRAAAEIDTIVARATAAAPEVDFTAADGVRHSAWTVSDPAVVARLQGAFQGIDKLYIADGHHRSAAAARVSDALGGNGASAWFLAVIFPHDQVQILPYHRLLKDCNGQTARRVLERLGTPCEMESPGAELPRAKNSVGFYIDGTWHTLRFRPEVAAAANPAEALDVALLQRHVLQPIFGIEDPRTSERIQFVGGIRGPAELKRRVDAGAGACAFSLYPTGIEELMAIADRDGIMPPKSTWFEPKLRDGMFCHMI